MKKHGWTDLRGINVEATFFLIMFLLQTHKAESAYFHWQMKQLFQKNYNLMTFDFRELSLALERTFSMFCETTDLGFSKMTPWQRSCWQRQQLMCEPSSNLTPKFGASWNDSSMRWVLFWPHLTSFGKLILWVGNWDINGRHDTLENTMQTKVTYFYATKLISRWFIRAQAKTNDDSKALHIAASVWYYQGA